MFVNKKNLFPSLFYANISHSYRLLTGREAFARATSTAREMKDACARLFKSLSLGPERLQFGLTKLFLRAGVVSLLFGLFFSIQSILSTIYIRITV